MSLTPQQVQALADHVLNAQKTATPIPMLTIEHPELSVEDGYAIQNALRERYLADGHRHVGWKAGLTSRAKMRQMGVDQPAVGFLTQHMAAAPGSQIEVARHVHPRVECEVAFVLEKDLPSEGCTVEDVLDATAFVVPSIEVIDSRYENFKFDLASVIADNTSSARYILGSNAMRLSDLDRTTLGVALLRNGEVIATGASAAVWGDPAASVALIANIAGTIGGRFEAGMTIMSGGITAAFAVNPGDCVSARFQKLGVVDIRFA
jgi:2-oxo-3-hexenedioate decarboxylase